MNDNITIHIDLGSPPPLTDTEYFALCQFKEEDWDQVASELIRIRTAQWSIHHDDVKITTKVLDAAEHDDLKDIAHISPKVLLITTTATPKSVPWDQGTLTGGRNEP